MATKISIIIPVYNSGKYLSQCIDSILNQTFRDFELICIDDGSTDDSLEILKNYQLKDSRIKIFTQNHQGVAFARNYGITLAKSEYIQFLDTDDYFDKDLLSEMLFRAEKFNTDVTICSYRKVDDNGNITESGNPNSPINLDKIPMESPFSREDFKEDIFNLLTPIVWNKLFKRSLITENRITSPNVRVASDIAFSHACIATAKKIIAFNKELINYRFNCAGSIATKRSKCTIDVVHSCNALKDFLINQRLFEDLETAFINAFKHHLRWDIGLCNDEEYKVFLHEFKQTIPEWRIYQSALRKDYINLEFIYNLIKNKKVMLWGASFFIQDIFKDEKKANPNILGYIDRNEALWDKNIGNYKVFAPEALDILKPDAVIMTIWSNNEIIYPILQKEFKEKYPKIELLPNIFEE